VNEDDVAATLKNGILTVVVPKKEIPEGKKIKLLKE
jgi:HSP20 family molecular chaperone IbpA